MINTIKEFINIQINSLNEQNAVLEINQINFKTDEEIIFYHNHKLQIAQALKTAKEELKKIEETENEKKSV